MTVRMLLARRVYLGGLFFVYLVAFTSLRIQIKGLYGINGVIPAYRYLQRALASEQDPWALFFRGLPSIFLWKLHSPDYFDDFMALACVLGITLSAIGIVDVTLGKGCSPSGIICACLYVLYLSFVTIGQTFLHFQWDTLLLETGFLAITIAPWIHWSEVPSWSSITIHRWLLFRLLFGSGEVKLNSTWSDLSAMSFHYLTTCLPNPLSYYFHFLPTWFHQGEVLATLFVELLLPFFVFADGTLRKVSALIQIGLQLAIASTGNYGFFNLLSIALCVLCFDDQTFAWLWNLVTFSWKRTESTHRSVPTSRNPSSKNSVLRNLKSIVVTLICVWLFVISAVPLTRHLAHKELPPIVKDMHAATQPFFISNSYGLFGHMTTQRVEIIVEGTRDGKNWQAYEFKFKPGDVKRAPPIVLPIGHMPRLDWQMWFAALSDFSHQPWFVSFICRLMEGQPDVLALLEHNPFPNEPPVQIRALQYDYQFAANGSVDGCWWKRTAMGEYTPSAITLARPSLAKWRKENGFL